MWKQIRNSVYEINEKGVVRNSSTKRTLKAQKTKSGYSKVGLWFGGPKQKKCRVNRLVAEAFLDDFNDEIEVRHINSIRDDNRVVNLMCVTSEYNKSLIKKKYITKSIKIKQIIETTLKLIKDSPNLTLEEIYEKVNAISY